MFFIWFYLPDRQSRLRMRVPHPTNASLLNDNWQKWSLILVSQIEVHNDVNTQKQNNVHSNSDRAFGVMEEPPMVYKKSGDAPDVANPRSYTIGRNLANFCWTCKYITEDCYNLLLSFTLKFYWDQTNSSSLLGCFKLTLSNSFHLCDLQNTHSYWHYWSLPYW